MNLWGESAIVVSAFLAGMVNSIAGGGTLISFPVLIWAGRDPVLANATSTVALWPGSFGGMVGFRRELHGNRRWILLLGAPSLVGGVLGALLLLRTPSNLFARLVPFLILFATALMALQEPLSRWLRRTPHAEPSRSWWAVAIIFQFFVGIYGGYFGAGIGIIMLAALGFLGLSDLHRMNALKNLFAICINGVAALYFIIYGAVIWVDVLLMATAAIAGGYFGASLAYKLGRKFVRYAVIAIGVMMAVAMFLFRR
ncbi:MAG TPA: sulfite exporter TauE/SafE family protein [Pyrinomonadaceae bacterium]|jgi:hypothetical protein